MAAFMEIAIATIGIGVVVMVGYLVTTQVQLSLTTAVDNDSAVATIVNSSLASTASTIGSGLSLIVIGIIVLAAFGLIQVFRG